MLQVGQAKALCDLYQANYDLVHAAWQCYVVDNDARKFIDTCKRIVRALTFDDAGNITMSEHPEDPDLAETVEVEYQNKTKTNTNTSASNSLNLAHQQVQQRDEDIAEAQERSDKSVEAQAAVSSAKRDLLKHSLEMMVKQGIATSDGASKLFARYQTGDALVDAAIEQYAEDRDVKEFLETLQILSSLSPKEIDQLMRKAADKLDEEDEEEDDDDEPVLPYQPSESSEEESQDQESEESESESESAMPTGT